MWNWNKFPEEEEKLPVYYRVMPHIITGYKTAEGKPIVIALQTPLDQAAKLVGLDIVPDLARQVLNGSKTVEQASMELGKNVLTSAPRQAWEMFNPLLKPVIEVGMNKNRFGSSIVPERLKGTPEANKMQVRYVLQSWFAPVANYTKVQRLPEAEKSAMSFLGRTALDWKRGLGIREIDIDQEAINRFYELSDKLSADNRSRKYQEEQGKIVADTSHNQRTAVNRTSDELSNWRKVQRVVENDPNCTPEQRKAINDMIDVHMSNLARAAVGWKSDKELPADKVVALRGIYRRITGSPTPLRRVRYDQ
jgi:hypothetical protein